MVIHCWLRMVRLKQKFTNFTRFDENDLSINFRDGTMVNFGGTSLITTTWRSCTWPSMRSGNRISFLTTRKGTLIQTHSDLDLTESCNINLFLKGIRKYFGLLREHQPDLLLERLSSLGSPHNFQSLLWVWFHTLAFRHTDVLSQNWILDL